ncbi:MULTISPECIES: TVP38/TMEM64 family protein [unclassified Bacillus (in: firmicutes)]|uniref:TVP38/TMEM64 family protein n=1 Tax=unclassified Bacillus (in: firmicutes) TaxID=185979 RepID=UPI0008E375DF|nr:MULTISPECIES: TVP38/TMEM64 family protein [unclassified Bacillus (in: firmicutes)]SFB13465.1 Uncharacterized membrane protein YdjX, TVP38/TMEM64 family, SNARE-associated domain [Bacillus sp. UNCCL13]SFQ90008.1 Uncharacterized membrane protein YdjX, TVP38/TMEM64 family, SNARE-associated domain [Bacillus sp. cl95]
MKRIITIIIMSAFFFWGYLEKEVFLSTIELGGPLAIMSGILFVGLLVFFPIIPFSVFAGTLGATFGVSIGVAISLSGIILGTTFMFSMARYGFYDWAQKTMNKYPNLKEYEGIFQKNAFLGILVARLVPVIPSPIINILCGVSNVSYILFILASAIGKLPSILIFTYAGSMFTESKILSFSIYGAYFMVILILSFIKLRRKQVKITV